MHLPSEFVLIFLYFTAANTVSYEGYKVYDVTTETASENEFLKSLEKEKNFDFWSKVNKIGKPVSVMVPPHFQSKFLEELKTRDIKYTVKINNVKSTIQAEKKYHQTRKALKPGEISFDQYIRHSQMNAYLSLLAEQYSDTVRVTTIGQSYENRSMEIIKISSSPDSTAKPVIFVEAGMHAREWIGPALALYIINQLVENPENRVYLNDVDWIVLPSMNPDGYEYTWEKDRTWRKTRSPGVICDGVDGNRNFGFHWMENGASNLECSDIFAGKEAFSESETRNLRDILAATENIAAFLSLHSYGQYLFYPYSYDDVVPDNWQELRDLAVKVNDVISAVNGTQYTIGSSTEVLYPAAGCSDDWAMGAAGIDIVYVFELPGGGEDGFDLPPSRILPVCSETWEGIKVIADYVAEKVRHSTS